MRFALEPHLVDLVERAEAFADHTTCEFGSFPDSWIAGYSKACSLALAERGWIGLTWPTAVGGGGRPPIERAIIAEVLITRGVPIGASWFADRQMGPTLIAFGSEAQQRQYLPGMLAGTDTWCIGMSEPDSGSDLASLRTRAVRDGDEFVISGRKIWTSFGGVADYCYLICRTESESASHEGISEIIVPLDGRPGIEIRPIRDATGSEHFCELHFDAARVPASNLVGNPGESWKQTMKQLEHERGGIDRLVSNRAVFQAAREYLDADRTRWTATLRDAFAALEADYRIGRMLVFREVAGQAPRNFSAATKTFCTEFQQRVSTFAAQAAGADALLASRWSHALMYAPAYTIMGGTANVLRNIISERILGLPRAGLT